jgi:hypothetical protein
MAYNYQRINNSGRLNVLAEIRIVHESFNVKHLFYFRPLLKDIARSLGWGCSEQ